MGQLCCRYPENNSHFYINESRKILKAPISSISIQRNRNNSIVNLTKDDFIEIKCIGKGGFSHVFLVQKKDNSFLKQSNKFNDIFKKNCML